MEGNDSYQLSLNTEQPFKYKNVVIEYKKML